MMAVVPELPPGSAGSDPRTSLTSRPDNLIARRE
jgi:hypothetical protein